ncbi:hypothetical protein S-CBP1_0004 [Synechococcus phage S-CBP1]|uniref:Uncharacterized protein n=1 Tax=Synechococcus phage S-CBP1 TaxID=1273711 RepID=A0A096VKD5_9CAUD|nr:hypothetical protein S-CBP1_0004 [Synechococcus phage S-CBP1]AGK86510.1 hypothetical protein S-CBP1_0004 [Synechococcus phage S-CBP1]
MYCIARINDDGNWEYLDNVPTYSDAEELLEFYCDMYPHAYIDILAVD